MNANVDILLRQYTRLLKDLMRQTKKKFRLFRFVDSNISDEYRLFFSISASRHEFFHTFFFFFFFLHDDQKLSKKNIFTALLWCSCHTHRVRCVDLGNIRGWTSWAELIKKQWTSLLAPGCSSRWKISVTGITNNSNLSPVSPRFSVRICSHYS